jgi:two-component system, chemotaxis family, CheB/CheR fusion protein
MYLNAETQGRILARFHFALKESGLLFLGKAEMLLSHTAMFSQRDLTHRVFTKVSKVSPRDRLFIMAQARGPDLGNYLDKNRALRELSFDATVISALVVDKRGVLCLANEHARQTFGIDESSIGQPFQDLAISYKPLELRSLIDQAYREKREVRVGKVPSTSAEMGTYWEVQVSPLCSNGDEALGVSIAFKDVTQFHQLYDDLQSAHEQLAVTNQELQSTNEELETTNEELQSTNEELETTNEELQSTNEELETTNEELQSTNEALESTNDKLSRLSESVLRTNVFLHSILGSMNSAVIVIDEGRRVLVWNRSAEDFWGLRSDEVVSSCLTELAIGLPMEPIERLLDEQLQGDEWRQVQIEAINRKGRKISCIVKVTPITRHDNSKGAVIFIDEIGAA